jgi:hypothetical protein
MSNTVQYPVVYGWLDGEPEIERTRPDIYAVNEDGDKPEKCQYCEEHSIELCHPQTLPQGWPPPLPKHQPPRPLNQGFSGLLRRSGSAFDTIV